MSLMSHSPTQRTSDRSSGSLSQLCTLCHESRLAGSLLSFQPGKPTAMLWVCDDCQHKLARRVDDEGALGG